LIENPTRRRAHVVHGLFQHAGGMQAIPHAPQFGSTASKLRGNVSEAKRSEVRHRLHRLVRIESVEICVICVYG
jgi:hypothetical protein